MAEDKGSYNLVTLFNYDTEAFDFKANNEPYTIAAGERRTFVKFMADLANKHFIDKMLLKKDPEGKLLALPEERAAVGAKFVVGEKKYEKPQIPTDREIVDSINRPSDLDVALKKDEPKVESRVPLPEPSVPAPKNIEIDEGTHVQTVGNTPVVPETPKKMTRPEMLDYAKNTLKLNTDHHMMKKRLAKLSDEDLYKELQIGQ